MIVIDERLLWAPAVHSSGASDGVKPVVCRKNRERQLSANDLDRADDPPSADFGGELLVESVRPEPHRLGPDVALVQKILGVAER